MSQGRKALAVCLSLLLAGVVACEQLLYLELTSKSRVEMPAEGGVGTIMFETNASYELSSDSGWCTLGEPVKNGLKVTVPYTCSVSDEYEQRSCTVSIEGLYNSATVSIVQKAATGVLVDSEELTLDYHGSRISIPTKSNVPYTVRIPKDCDWIRHLGTRELTAAEEVFEVQQNISRHPRSAAVTLDYSSGATRVTVTQEGCKHFIVEKESEGLYGIDGADFVYTPGGDQRQIVRRSGSFDYRILSGDGPVVVELSSIPSEPEEGMEFTGGVSLIAPEGLLYSYDFTMAVLRIEDGLLWLGIEDDAGAILKY